MRPTKWDDCCNTVRIEMERCTKNSVTPISRSEDLNHGFAEGTGTYVTFPSGHTVVLTNEHVARRIRHDMHLSHLPIPGENYELLPEFRVWEAPMDFAACFITHDRLASNRIVISSDVLDQSCNPEPQELLYWYGFPGSTALRHDPISEQNTRYSWFNELHVGGLSMVSQQVPEWPDELPDECLHDHHIAVHYPSQAQEVPGGPMVDLPNPKGLSGSLLWDTKFVSCLQRGISWKPEFARVCGVIWATWPNPEVVIATKVQFLHRFITEVDMLPTD